MAPTPRRLRIERRRDADAVVVEPVGVLDGTTCGVLREYLLRCAADQPRAVVVDLAEVELPSVTALAVFSSVAAEVSDWPGVPILLVSPPDGQVSRRSVIRRFVPVHDTVASALADQGPAVERLVARMELPNARGALASARRFTAVVCENWRVPATTDVMLVANELVQNALQHTLSAPVLRVELRRGLLSVAVYDGSPQPPVLRDRGRSGYGLKFVARLSTAWGWVPTTDGGKAVWAALRV